MQRSVRETSRLATLNDLTVTPSNAVTFALLLRWRRLQRRLDYERWWGPVRGVEGISQLRACVVGDFAWRWLSAATFSTRLRKLNGTSIERAGNAWRSPGVDVIIASWTELGRLDEWTAPVPVVAARDRPHDGRQAPCVSTHSIDLPPLDISRLNPNGVPWEAQHSLFAIRTAPNSAPRLAAHRSTTVRAGLGEIPCSYLDVAVGRGGTWTPDHDERLRRLVVRFRGCAAALDDRANHQSDWHQAIVISRLAAMGVPVVLTAPPSREVEALLGPDLTTVLRATTLESALDAPRRERLSVELQRGALPRFSVRGTLTRALLGTSAASHLPSVSVLLSTRRPGQLAHALQQLNRQDYQRAQVILVLHGIARDSSVDGFVGDCQYPVSVVTAGAEASFGEALNEGLREAGGACIAKVDDDDWYGVHHLSDLVWAKEYSAADLVGKGSEFVFLSNENLTIRRSSRGQRFTPSIGGPTLLFSRQLAEAVGGFPHRPSGIDWGLKQAARRVGGRIYRTHGLEFILHRHGNLHTWDAADEYFAQGAESRWRGLQFSAAAIET